MGGGFGVVVHGSVADMVSVKEGGAPELTAQETLDMDVAGIALFNFWCMTNLSSTWTTEAPLWVGPYGITGLPGHWLGGTVEYSQLGTTRFPIHDVISGAGDPLQ